MRIAIAAALLALLVFPVYAQDRKPGAQCGGLMGTACGEGEWCDYPDGGQCGAADQTGTCKPRPEACTQQYDPVCGCDRQTYGNGCEAAAAGADIASTGECPA